MSFPTSVTAAIPTVGTETLGLLGSGTGLSGLLNYMGVDLAAVETKIGTGASTPASNTILYGTGAGTSAWQGLTSAQLASIVSDETGSAGSLVFSNSPTIVTPTIASFTNAQHNHSNAANGGSIAAGAFAQGAIAAPDLSTSAITLGYAQITSSITTASTSVVQATGLTSTVTIPAGGRRVKVTAYSVSLGNATPSNGSVMSLWDGTVGSGTQLQQLNQIGLTNIFATLMFVHTPVAGSKTYNVGFVTVTSGTTTLSAGATNPAFILVEAI